MMRHRLQAIMPRRRTFAAGILPSAHSETSALRHPGSAGRLRRLEGIGNPEPRSFGRGRLGVVGTTGAGVCRQAQPGWRSAVGIRV